MSKQKPATIEEMWAALDVIQLEVEANRRGQVTEHQLAKFKVFQSEAKSNAYWFFVPFGALMVCGLASQLCAPMMRNSKTNLMPAILVGIGLLIFMILMFVTQQSQMDTDVKTLSVAMAEGQLKVRLVRPSGRGSSFRGNRYYVGVSNVQREISQEVYELFKTREHELFRVYYLANSKWLLSLEPVSEIPQQS